VDRRGRPLLRRQDGARRRRRACGWSPAPAGVAVFAHPGASKRGRTVGDDVIADMAAAGLAGLEVDHVDHEPDARAHLRGLSAELGLLTTGSSDFHGTNKTVRLAANTTTQEQYEQLVAREEHDHGADRMSEYFDATLFGGCS
jgi:predicted metal-dependent phosphoesterase TrpH